MNINQLSDEEYLNIFSKGNEDSISLAKKKDLLGLFGQKTCVETKNSDRPGFDNRSLCKKLQDNQTAKDNQFAPGRHNGSVYNPICPSEVCENGKKKKSLSWNSDACVFTNPWCDCFLVMKTVVYLKLVIVTIHFVVCVIWMVNV